MIRTGCDMQSSHSPADVLFSLRIHSPVVIEFLFKKPLRLESPQQNCKNDFLIACSLFGTSGFFFFSASKRKHWTPRGFRCITIETERKTPLAKFEECLQRLEKIVQELEKGEVPLEKSLTLFEEGMQLSSACRKELEQAEGKVEILLKKNGKLQAEPFEPLSDKATARR